MCTFVHLTYYLSTFLHFGGCFTGEPRLAFLPWFSAFIYSERELFRISGKDFLWAVCPFVTQSPLSMYWRISVSHFLLPYPEASSLFFLRTPAVHPLCVHTSMMNRSCIQICELFLSLSGSAEVWAFWQPSVCSLFLLVLIFLLVQ